jgi:L-methionine (R)-S-oxide reductase
MEGENKRRLYGRIADQLAELFRATRNPVARMATAAALLSAKLPGFFWTGWYLLEDGKLTVGAYQGPLACLVLPDQQGVCWEGIKRNTTVVVADVHQFAGHVACDARSRSEIVVPLRNAGGEVVGVLDVDSENLAHFDEIDQQGLERIVALIYYK